MKSSRPFIMKFIFVITVVSILFPTGVLSQSGQKYWETDWRPSFWFNSVDGIQVGARFFTFLDTDEYDKFKISAGAWVHSKRPDNPVSYEFSFSHPLVMLNQQEEAFNIQFQSSIRDGLRKNSIGLSKNYLINRDYRKFVQVGVQFDRYKKFEPAYLNFMNTWSEGSQNIGLVKLAYSNESGTNQKLGADISGIINTGKSNHTIQANINYFRRLNQVFEFRAGISAIQNTNDSNRPEHNINLALSSPYDLNDNQWLRSRGTLPVKQVEDGLFTHYRKGSVLRGYVKHDLNRINSPEPITIEGMRSISVELDFMNPLNNLIKRMGPLNEFLKFRSYLFADAGHVNYRALDGEYYPPIIGIFLPYPRYDNPDNFLANTGVGFLFDLNIPDHHNKRRGFALRWDIPFWLSDPSGDQNNLKFRNQLSIDFIILF